MNSNLPSINTRLIKFLKNEIQIFFFLAPVTEQEPSVRNVHQLRVCIRKLQNTLDVLEGLIEATYSRDARAILARVNLLLEKLRHLFRLAKDLHFLDLRRYEFAARATDEIGRLVGGWLKAGKAVPDSAVA